jgi:hypothetical protein
MRDIEQNQGQQPPLHPYILWIKDIRDMGDIEQNQGQQPPPTPRYPVDIGY